MNNPETKNILKHLKEINANEAWKEETRNFLLSEIANTPKVKQETQPFFEKLLQPNWQLIMRPVGTMLITLAVVGGSVATVRASRGSLPGDVLYPIKRNVENVTISFTFDKTEKIRKKVELVGKRIEELNTIAAKDIEAPQKSEKIQRAVEEIKKDSTKVDEQLQEILEIGEANEGNQDSDVINEVKKLAVQGDAYEKTLNDISDNLPDDIKSDSKKIVKEALTKIEETNVKAVVVIVKEHKSGKVEIQEEEVNALVEKALGKAQQKLETSKAKLDEAKKVESDKNDAADAQTEEVDQENTEEDTNTQEEDGVESDSDEASNNEEPKEDVTNDENTEDDVDAEKLIEEASQKLNNADELLTQKDYDNVISILQESTQVLQVVETEVAKVEEVVYNKGLDEEINEKTTEDNESQENADNSANEEDESTEGDSEPTTEETLETTTE